jgi:hypothetical protein
MTLTDELKSVLAYKPEGGEALWHTFGLSYASWLVMPRVMMHAMPDEWQGKMAALIDEFHDEFNWPEDLGDVMVSCRVNGKIAKLPKWLAYRHSAPSDMDRFRRNAALDKSKP